MNFIGIKKSVNYFAIIVFIFKFSYLFSRCEGDMYRIIQIRTMNAVTDEIVTVEIVGYSGRDPRVSFSY